MKLHLPNKLRRMVMACLALSITGTFATTVSTAVWGVGLCLVSWQQTAAAVDVLPDGANGGYQISGKVSDNIQLTANKYITPLGVDSEITGVINGTNNFIYVWNSNVHPQAGPYTLTLSGYVTNVAGFYVGGRNRVVISTPSGYSAGLTTSTLYLNGIQSANALGDLVFNTVVYGFNSIAVDVKNDVVGKTGNIIINGTFQGNGTLSKTGGGTLDMNGSVVNVKNFSANGGTTNMKGQFIDLETLNVYSEVNISGKAALLKEIRVGYGAKVNLLNGCNFNNSLNANEPLVVDCWGSGGEFNIVGNSLTLGAMKLSLSTGGSFNVLEGGAILYLGDVSVDMKGGSFEVMSGGMASGKMELKLTSGSFNVAQGGKLELFGDSSIELNSSTVQVSFDGTLSGDGDLTKKGEAELVLNGEIKHTGSLIVEEGSVQWSSGAAADQKLGFSSVEVQEGTQFSIKREVTDASDTTVKLNGGELAFDSEVSSAVIRELKLEQESSVAFHENAGDGSGVSFERVTGNGDLHIKTVATEEDPAWSVNMRVASIYNYEGSVEIGKTADTSRIELGTVHQDAGYSATWKLDQNVTSPNFAKTGEGRFVILGDGVHTFTIKTPGYGELLFGYEGELVDDSHALRLLLGDGTILRYNTHNGKTLLDLVKDVDGGISLEGDVYVRATDFSIDELKKGVALGLSAEDKDRVNVQGTAKSELREVDGRLYLHLAADADWKDWLQDSNSELDAKKKTTLKTTYAELTKDASMVKNGIGVTDDAMIGKDVAVLEAASFDYNARVNGRNNVFGGSALRYDPSRYSLLHDGTPPTYRGVEANGGNVWILAKDGFYGVIGGGNYAHTKAAFHAGEGYKSADGGYYAISFKGDTHIMIGEKGDDTAGLYVGSIVGGNYGNDVWHVYDRGRTAGMEGKPISSTFVGDSWISIYTGKVDWVVGGSYQTIYDFVRSAVDMADVQDVTANPEKFSQGSFTGDSHVFIYHLLQGADETNDPETDFVAGGNLIDMRDSVDYLVSDDVGIYRGQNAALQEDGYLRTNSIPFYFNGNSYVKVDLGREKGTEVSNPEAVFGKMLVGGDYMRHDRGWAEHNGSTYLYITGATGVKFSERVIGGNYDDGNSYTHLTGDANVFIDSGTFFNMVVAGSNQGKITSMHADKPITSFRKALFSTIDGGTYLTITDGRFTGYASSMEELIPDYTLGAAERSAQPRTNEDGADLTDEVMSHSVGRVAVVGGNYLSQAANASKNLVSINEIKGGTHVDITGGVFSGHIVGASVMEGDSHHTNDDDNPNTSGGGESNQWVQGFRGVLDVASSTLNIDNARVISREREEQDSQYAERGWVPRVVGGYLLHVADDRLNNQIVTAQWDNSGIDSFYYIGVHVGHIEVSVSNSTVYDVVGGSWTSCLDVSADEWHRFLYYYSQPREEGPNYNFDGVKQENVSVTLDNVVVKGDVIAAGIQGGISRITTENTVVNISDSVTFETPENPYRKENIVTGGYFSERHKDYETSKESDTWSEEADPYYSFYKGTHYDNKYDYPGAEVYASEEEKKDDLLNVSYVQEWRSLNFTSNEDNYADNIHHTILLNFDYVNVLPKAIVNAAGLLITDEGKDGSKNTIYLRGGGEMQLVPDFMLIPVWEKRADNGSLIVPEIASDYKWLHNNSYIVVQGQGTMLTLLTSETRDGWIAMDKVYDDLLNVQKLRVENGSILHIDQRLAEGSPMGVNAQPVAVRDDIYMCQGSAMMLDTNISLNEMRTREDAAIREAEIITDLRTDAEGKVTNGKKPTENISDYTVSFEKAGNGDKPTFRLHIDRVEDAFYKQDKFRRYLIDYVNPEAFNSAWANEQGVESSVTEGSIAYDAYTQHTLEKWFEKSDVINGYDKYRIRVKDNDDGTYSLVIEGMRLKDDDVVEEEEEIPDPPTPPVPPDKRKPGYHKRHAHTPNGKAGADLLDEYYPNPSENSKDRDKVLDRVFELNVAGREKESDRLEAAVAGSSISALGMAAADDVERQLRLVRNRATKSLRKEAVRMRQRQVDGGKAGIRIHEYPEVLPPNRYSVWVNGEGDYRLTAGESTDPGYRMSAWGGTVGGSYAITNDVEAGLAITAMYGDFRSKGPDALNGDMDTSYLSTFVRVDSGRWSHLFIATLGLVDIDATRTVNIGGGYGSYNTSFDTQGYALGLMYELGYTIMLNREKTAMIQPVANIAWRHVVVDGFTESGSDAALRADRQEPESFILGAGVRSQMLLGGETLNRNLLLELRALAKGYLGSLRNTTEVGFADRSRRAVVRSRRQGPLGLEIGAGLTIPLTTDTEWEHAIFFDLNLELRNALDNANFTVGYKMGF